jgi:predicted dinucleotide-binding enzyme
MGKGPVGFTNTSDAILANIPTNNAVKCFNTTGFNNMGKTSYGYQELDAFVAGDRLKRKEIAKVLAIDAGFAACYDIGGNNMFELMEKFAFLWIYLAIFK